MKPKDVPSDSKVTLFTGVPPAAYGGWLASAFAANPGPWIVLGPNMGALESLAQDFVAYQTLTAAKNPTRPHFFPETALEDTLPKQQFEIDCDRLSVLSSLLETSPKTWSTTPRMIFTTVPAMLGPCPTTAELGAKEVTLIEGKSIDFESLKSSLSTRLGYDHEVLCEAPGQYAIRGGLVDIYPPNTDRPYRIDFFGNEIESIRPYDPTTQRSCGNPISKLTLAPLLYSVKDNTQTAPFSDYLKGPVRWLVPWSTTLTQETTESLKNLLENSLSNKEDVWYGLTDLDTLETNVFGGTAERVALEFESLEAYRPSIQTGFGLERIEIEREQRQRFLSQVLTWQEEGNKVLFACNNEGELKRLREYLEENPKLKPLLGADFAEAPLREGFRAHWGKDACPLSWAFLRDATGLVILSDAEIFGRYRTAVRKQNRRQEAQHKAVDQLLDFSELIDGDHLVHLQHGICRYRGLQEIEIRGSSETVISLEFEDGILLHLPLHESHLVTRYVGFQKTGPRLAKLGGNTWEKTKRAAEKASMDFAAKLLNVQAQRADEPGFRFSPDHPWQQSFESAFLHTETADQLKAIQEVKADMEDTEPMDRLLCGDVGFGKTEVALRAAFKAVMDGKQVAVLVPTTVLCQQHFNTFRERLADYPVSVEMLSRFRSAKQQKSIIEALKCGKVDMLIGTHRLLSKDIVFKDLGLLIIDEEHRFGVRHKEQIKEIKAHVDVLAMSATPIPRSLYMALVGARDLSVIETPPHDRLPIQTIVKGYDLKLIEQAIRYEIERGGQVFYLHNRVSTIEAVAQRLAGLIPNLRVAVGHGQMSEIQLERVMTQFVDGKHDVLVSTTIIESGLDIPNCNTLIIESADRFGLAQLYQIRGRVGRFNRQAYAYLLLHRHARVVEHAHKRLSALRQHNQLGAGYRIAMRDLELRGAGNILGKEQSGHIAGVGFDLYCQLLRQSITRLKSQDPLAGLIRSHVRLDFVHLGEGVRTERDTSHETDFKALKAKELEVFKSEAIEACIPEAYVGETRLRIDTYRQLAMAADKETLESIEQALLDRFGPLPPSVQALIWLSKIRCAAEKKELVSIETEGNQLKCQCLRSTRGNFLKHGGRFPRLTQRDPFLKLQEILKFIENHRVV